MALVARTSSDARDVLVEDMARGAHSGVMQVCPPWFKPYYEPSKRRLTWPNGATATLYSADEPDRLRGPQHDCALADEVAAWKYEDAWTQLMFGLRLGDDPRCVVTTTPRPTKTIKDLVARADGDVAVVTGTTYENKPNLAPAFFEEIIREYEGTRLGRQELLAEILAEVEGALWTHDLIDDHRVKQHPPLQRLAVAVDPAGSRKQSASETGIVAGGCTAEKEGYLLADRSGHYSPIQWARQAIDLYETFEADCILAEKNFGGEMVEHTIKSVDSNIPVKLVSASRGKMIRAQPIVSKYEQGLIHHVGTFPKLEDQLCTWTPEDDSPDRLDANVWLWTYLVMGRAPGDIGITVGKDPQDYARDTSEFTAEEIRENRRKAGLLNKKDSGITV